MDPFENYILDLLELRKKALPDPPKPHEKEEPAQLPFEVNMTHSYIKSYEYLRKRKALKQQNKY